MLLELFFQMEAKYGIEEAIDHFEKGIDQIDLTIEKLHYDADHKPLRLVGLKLTSSLLGSIYTFIFTILITIIQFYFQSQVEQNASLLLNSRTSKK